MKNLAVVVAVATVAGCLANMVNAANRVVVGMDNDEASPLVWGAIQFLVGTPILWGVGWVLAAYFWVQAEIEEDRRWRSQSF